MIKTKKYKICRRLGPGVYEKCQTAKFAMSGGAPKRGKGRGQSEFSTQLLEKQKIRFMYGVSEKQFRKYVDEATAKKGVAPTKTLHNLLERRLDNVVYRTGLASGRTLARQLVSHGHITVNGRKLTIPSYLVKVGDKIAVRDGSKKSPLFAELPKRLKNYSSPAWMNFDAELASGEIKGAPEMKEEGLAFNTVLEYYSR